MPGSKFPLEIQPRIPAELGRLGEMANDLMYTWDRSIRSLFYRLDRELWEVCGHNPKVFLRQVSQQRLTEAGEPEPGLRAWSIACHALFASSRFQILE